MTMTEAPATDARCWPFGCGEYHATYGHQSGEDPCRCECHIDWSKFCDDCGRDDGTHDPDVEH